MSEQSEWERERTVHLNGDKHETVMTERSGLFSIYCGCGWKAQDLPIEAALSAEAAHPDEGHNGRVVDNPKVALSERPI